MKVIGKNIAVIEIKEEIKSESGLFLSDEDKKDLRYKKGQIVMPGTDVPNIETKDLIYFDSRQAYTLMINGEHLTIIQERDVVVVL